METLQNIDTIISVISGIGSIAMFILARNEKCKAEKEKEECIKIRAEINNLMTDHRNQQLSDIDGNKNMVSNDSYSISNVENFDNRKSIR